MSEIPQGETEREGEEPAEAESPEVIPPDSTGCVGCGGENGIECVCNPRKMEEFLAG